ncbi:uncharacterized protein PFL1_02045 [Pseudozyma flocculosa PF-1]|uniref:Uncharacterized protein n=1 Tax=Pseudozyma flocculosa TaxID=84751 RepID=A0A5C3EZG0_9BASI|nr:uncharacterized protein PFL1_02045 [Pseudozyma flocculosa PF-1]EPQ30519.1 hypothetical protein PFL1_02045 [Pseudozyma flocculosa PF-1]SPO37608.1 uncharacterized protein PSFLO_03083 [Pseudozyma flocculosa]
MPQAGSPFSSPGAAKANNVLSPFKNSQNAATLLAKNSPTASSSKKANLNNLTQSPKATPAAAAAAAKPAKPSTPSGSGGAGGSGSGSGSSSGVARSFSGASSPYSQRIASLAAAATGHAVFESPLLPREQETTYHRKLRTLLQQYAAQAEAWEEVVTYDGLKHAKQALDAWEDLESARNLGASSSSSGPRPRQWKTAAIANQPAAHDPVTGPGGLKERRMADALLAIERAEVGLADVTTRLDKHLAKIVQTSDAIAALLPDAAKARGLEFAFQEPMWGTWPLERFVSYITGVTPSYVLSTSHLALLVPILLRPKASPAPSSSDPNRVSKASFAREDSASKDGKPADPNAHRRKAFEDWIALPHLETKGRGSMAWFEAVCRVEVGKYLE